MKRAIVGLAIGLAGVTGLALGWGITYLMLENQIDPNDKTRIELELQQMHERMEEYERELWHYRNLVQDLGLDRPNEGPRNDFGL